MGRKKKPVPDDPEQYARFVETAERIQDENSEKRFGEAIKQILSAEKPKPKREPEEADPS